MALEQNLSKLGLQEAVEVTGDKEILLFGHLAVRGRTGSVVPPEGEAAGSAEGEAACVCKYHCCCHKEVEASHLALAASIHQSQLDPEYIFNLEQRVVELQQTLAQKDQVLGKHEHSLRLIEEAFFDGTFLWKITNVTKRCHESVYGRTVSLSSATFYNAKYGYKLCLYLYLNGDGSGKKTHLSLSIVIMRVEYDALLPWPFRNKVTFMLLDQNNREHAIDAFWPDLSTAPSICLRVKPMWPAAARSSSPSASCSHPRMPT